MSRLYFRVYEDRQDRQTGMSWTDEEKYLRYYDRQYEQYFVPPVGSYVSIRLTRPHSEWGQVREKILKDAPWYISYPHFGKGGNNEHFHIFVPGGIKDAKRYRERCKAHSYSGNKFISVKCHENGVLSAITYGAREGTTPSFCGSHCKRWINIAPEWQNANLRENLNPDLRTGEKRKREDEEGIRITQRNFLRICFEYRTTHNMSTTSLADVMVHMFAHGHYLCPTFARQGMPDFYLHVFSDSCEKGRICYAGTKTIWSSAIFRNFNKF